MFWSSFLAFLVLQDVYATPTPLNAFSKREDAKFALKEAKSFAPATALKASDKIVNLKQTGLKSKSSKALVNERAAGITTLTPVEQGAGYGADIQLGGQSFTLIFDTGSSDLWVAETGVECVNANGNRVPVARCAFGPLFSGNFEEAQIPKENFYIQYGDGEVLTGALGYEDVTVAGVTVKHQEIASVDLGYWVGDGVTSGIIGFAYSTLTNAYKGTNPANDGPSNLITYTNFLGHAIKQGKISPMFSLALERGANGGTGQLALGGLPTIDFNHDFTTVPLQIVDYSPNRPIGATKYTFYTIDLDGIVLDGQVRSTNFPIIVDSGTTLVYLPPSLAKAINKAFNPPSKFIQAEGIWENFCDATPPKISIRIGGTDFHISHSEVLIPKPVGYDSSTGGCVTGFQPSAQQPYVLGDVFLKNVVAVYDIGASEMRFAPHEKY